MSRRKPTALGDFTSYVVTGRTRDGKRFSASYSMARWAFAINLWNGRVWGVLPTGKRKLLKTVIN